MASALPVAQSVAARIFANSPSDQATFVRQMKQEAGGEDLTSPAGAQGPAQIMPATAEAWGVHNVHDPEEAYTAAAQHMKEYLAAYHGSWADALTAYNAGPGAVGHALPGETQNYIATILGGKGGTSMSQGGDTGAPATGAPTTTTTSLDKAAFTDAQHKAILSGFLSKNGSMGELFRTGLLGSSAPPNPADFMVTKTSTAPAAAASSILSGAQAPTVKGVAPFGGKQVAAWIAPALALAQQRGWKGGVESGYRTLAQQTAIYDSGVRPAAKPGTSNHEMTAFPGGAVDVTDPQGLSRALQGTKYEKLLVWAGAKDPVHFSHPHNGSY